MLTPIRIVARPSVACLSSRLSVTLVHASAIAMQHTLRVWYLKSR